MELMNAHRQWATRAPEERFVSLDDLCNYQDYKRQHSMRKVMANRDLTVVPIDNETWDVGIQGPQGNVARFTHWGFNLTCQRADAPAAYFRKSQMPAALVSDCLNWGLHFARDVEDVSVLMRSYPDDAPAGFEPGLWMGAMNGPNYGVIWDHEVAFALRDNFGDGLTGKFRIPGEFGEQVAITKENTTLFSSDRSMFGFLADEENRIEVPNRRDGKAGSMARGFFIGNSENGGGPLVFGTFLFDYVCCNRIIWGVQEFQEIRMRHTSGAPWRFIEEILPVLKEYAEGSPKGVQETIAAAKEKKLTKDVDEFLATRFGGAKTATKIKLAWENDEGQRPMETLFDVVTAATAFARAIPFQEERIEMEKAAGKLLALAA